MERKAVFVQELFRRIAGHYDRMNRLMTLGRDRGWRRYTVAQALALLSSQTVDGASTARRLLDVATGTGELALEALRQGPALKVVGLDFVPQMLSLAQKKARAVAAENGADGGRLQFIGGDALRLPFPDASFDAAVTGFAMRNVVDIPAAFAEIARVTRPGGRIACLEITKPRLPVFRQLFAVYFYRLVPLLGKLFARENTAYVYLPHSLTAFLTPDELAEVMRRAGWRDVSFRRLMLGTVAVHVGVKRQVLHANRAGGRVGDC